MHAIQSATGLWQGARHASAVQAGKAYTSGIVIASGERFTVVAFCRKLFTSLQPLTQSLTTGMPE